MDKIRTATGKEFDTDYIATIPNPEMAFIRICNAAISEVAAVFSEPRETMQLYSGNVYLAQYTRLVGLQPEPGAVKVHLAKE